MALPKRCKRYGVGKEIGGAVYLHRSLEHLLGDVVEDAKNNLPDGFEYDIVKHNRKNDAVSFIACEDFDGAPEPTVGNSVLVHPDGTVKKRRQAKDPEIYHHKWLFVDDSYEGFDVTESKERSRSWSGIEGLNRRKIGKKSYWETEVLPKLNGKPEKAEEVEQVTPQIETHFKAKPQTIARHKTAIKRGSFSRPVKCLLRDGLLTKETTFFDYGCGHGRDLDLLSDIEIECGGWDPAHRPTAKRCEADVVNIGYVINVIEDRQERTEAVKSAWKLARKVLCVAAQVEFATPDKEQQVYGDGCLTSRGTFQKYYNQHELREYLQEALGTDAVSAAPGVFYLFKCEEVKQQFFASRYQRRYTVPRRCISEVLFEQNRDLLDPYMDRITELGRLPGPDEFDMAAAVIEKFGSLKRAFKLIQKVTDESPWEEIAQRRTEDLLVYLALSRFGKRPSLSKLPLSVQRDLREFFGGYKIACDRADALLFQVGDPEAIDQACQRAKVGHLVDNALVFHKSCLDYLEPMLRIYEGCARALVGELDDANVIKLHRHSGKVSYITYEDFERNPHPPLTERIKVSLRSQSIDWFDYSDWQDRLLLQRKFVLLPEDHKKRKLFERMCRQEYECGVLRLEDVASSIDQIKASVLRERLLFASVQLRGHRVVKSR